MFLHGRAIYKIWPRTILGELEWGIKTPETLVSLLFTQCFIFCNLLLSHHLKVTYSIYWYLWCKDSKREDCLYFKNLNSQTNQGFSKVHQDFKMPRNYFLTPCPWTGETNVTDTSSEGRHYHEQVLGHHFFLSHCPFSISHLML